MRRSPVSQSVTITNIEPPFLTYRLSHLLPNLNREYAGGLVVETMIFKDALGPHCKLESFLIFTFKENVKPS